MLALLLDQDQRVGGLLLAGGFMALSFWLSYMATKAGSSAGSTGAYGTARAAETS